MLRSFVHATVTTGLWGCLALSDACSALAAPVIPPSYDLPNGDGQAHGGTFNYWDKAYTGGGNTATDGAPLSGGHGDLTDGVIATQNWFDVENSDGTGPYVGWRDTDPTIVFHFNESLRFSSITLHADDADGQGGVFAPGGITVGGTRYTFADPTGSAPNTFTVDGLGLVGQDIEVTLHRGNASSNWTFVSEVTFEATAVPEPAHWALALAGLGTIALWQRSRQQQAR